MKYLEYNEENLKVVSDIIRSKLTIDLLPRKWVHRNGKNKFFGHCHNASGCLYNIFGPDEVSLYRGLDDEGIYHWWIVDKQGKLIDLTSEQYTNFGRIPPHDRGEKNNILGFEYRKRVQKLTDRVKFELQRRGYNIESDLSGTLDDFFKD